MVLSMTAAGCASDPHPSKYGGSAGGGAVAGSTAPAADGGRRAEPTLPTLAAPLTPGPPGSADVTLEVRTDKPSRLISDLIYGTNGAPESMRTRQTVVRSGGNRMTAYNWENNASNAGSDYMFQNDNYLSASSEPAKPIACADVLGIFGRDGVDLATYWPLGGAESSAYAAFRAYRNYDGAGATFGNVSLSATTSDVENVTVYGSLHADATDRVVLIAINKATPTRPLRSNSRIRPH